MTSHRTVAILLFPDVQSLDVTGPLEVLQGATRYLRHTQRAGRAYTVCTASLDGGPIQTSTGLRVLPDHAFDELVDVHSILIPGGAGVDAAVDAGLPDAITQLIERVAPKRVISVCSGALLLAATGLLAGRRVATHWADCETLRQRHPEVRVDNDALYVEDGRYWTSAGVTAGMDLALSLVERDLGREVALHLARWLVLFLHRPGGQAQFSAQLAHQLAAHDSLRSVQTYVVEHPHADCSNPTLAKRAGMSPRSFSRRFKSEVGVTPARFVQGVRVDAARRLLEQESLGLDAIAEQSGFGSIESMRRCFVERLSLPPSHYRQRFRLRSQEPS